MKRKKISETIENINHKYIDEATEYIPKANNTSKSWIKWASLAACFVVLVIASFSILPSIFENNDVIDGKYKYHISGSEVDVEWPWEYKTNAEKYHSAVLMDVFIQSNR